jgi:hypothetical protein
MDKISDVTVGESVYINSRREKGAIVEVRESSLIVRLLTGRVEVREGDFERR